MAVVDLGQLPNRYALAWDLYPTSRFSFTKDLEKILEEYILHQQHLQDNHYLVHRRGIEPLLIA